MLQLYLRGYYIVVLKDGDGSGDIHILGFLSNIIRNYIFYFGGGTVCLKVKYRVCLKLKLLEDKFILKISTFYPLVNDLFWPTTTFITFTSDFTRTG